MNVDGGGVSQEEEIGMLTKPIIELTVGSIEMIASIDANRIFRYSSLCKADSIEFLVFYLSVFFFIIETVWT